MASSVELYRLLKSDLGGDVTGGEQLGLGCEGGVEAVYVGLVVFSVVEGHYFFGDVRFEGLGL